MDSTKAQNCQYILQIYYLSYTVLIIYFQVFMNYSSVQSPIFTFALYISSDFQILQHSFYFSTTSDVEAENPMKI